MPEKAPTKWFRQFLAKEILPKREKPPAKLPPSEPPPGALPLEPGIHTVGTTQYEVTVGKDGARSIRVLRKLSPKPAAPTEPGLLKPGGAVGEIFSGLGTVARGLQEQATPQPGERAPYPLEAPVEAVKGFVDPLRQRFLGTTFAPPETSAGRIGRLAGAFIPPFTELARPLEGGRAYTPEEAAVNLAMFGPMAPGMALRAGGAPLRTLAEAGAYGARRGAAEALVRAPGRVLPEAGLRVAGARGVRGAAATLGETPMGRTPQETLGLIEEKIIDITATLEGRRQLVRPSWAAGLTDDQLMNIAKQEGVNPFKKDWGDALDSVVIGEAKRGAYKSRAGLPTIKQLEAERRRLQAEAKRYRESIAEETLIPEEVFQEEPLMTPRTSVQTGLPGVGRAEAQAQMLGEFKDIGRGKQGLLDAEALRASQAAKPLPGQGTFLEGAALPLSRTQGFALPETTMEGLFTITNRGALYRLDPSGIAGTPIAVRTAEGWVGYTTRTPLRNTPMAGAESKLERIFQEAFEAQRAAKPAPGQASLANLSPEERVEFINLRKLRDSKGWISGGGTSQVESRRNVFEYAVQKDSQNNRIRGLNDEGKARLTELEGRLGAAPLAEAAAPAAREPWQMTRSTFTSTEQRRYFMQLQEAEAKIGNPALSQANLQKLWEGGAGASVQRGHRLAVVQALRAGKPVPAEVLAEYPGLAAAPAPRPAGAETPLQAAQREIQEVIADNRLTGAERRAKAVPKAVLPTEKPVGQQAAAYEAVRPAPPPVAAKGVSTPSPAEARPQAAGVPPLTGRQRIQPGGGYASGNEPPTGLGGGATSIPPEQAGTRYLAALRPLAEVQAEVVTTANPVIRWLVGKTGINPSVLSDNPVGKALTGYYRQRVASEQLIDTALSAALDSHAQRLTGRLGGFLPLDEKGIIKGTGKMWNDVFSRPYLYAISARGTPLRAYIDDYLQVIADVNLARAEAGLKPLALGTKDGVFYVPRQVKGIRGIELERPSSPKLQRVYEEASEGVANGVKYEADPRATLKVHVQAALREIADKQLSDILEPLSVAPKGLISEKIRGRMESAIVARFRAEREVNRLKVPRVEKQGLVTPEEKALRAKLTPQRAAAQEALIKARAEYSAAKVIYKRAMEAAKKAEIAKGSLFGVQEEKIPIAMWRNRFYPREQAKALEEGLRFATGQETGFNKVVNTIRTTASAGDFASPFIQGLPLLARRPWEWAQMVGYTYQGFFNPRVQAAFMRKHLATFQKMAQYGVPVSESEFFAGARAGGGLEPGALLAKLPGGTQARAGIHTFNRQTGGRFMASYDASLSSARALLWEATEPTWKAGLDELAAYVRNMTGGLDTRALGVGPTQRAAESVWLAFSPRLLRSTFALTADAVRGTPMLIGREVTARQAESLRTLGTLLAGATGIYVLTGIALGKSDEEIWAGLNPLNGARFMSHEINGEYYGVGGQIRAILQLTAGVASALAPGGKPAGVLLDPGLYDNPLLSFYRGRAPLGYNVAGTFLEAATEGRGNLIPYKTIDSVPDIFLHLGESALPFIVQNNLEGQSILSQVASGVGARTSIVRETPEEKRMRQFQERLQNPAERIEKRRQQFQERLQRQAVPAGTR